MQRNFLNSFFLIFSFAIILSCSEAPSSSLKVKDPEALDALLNRYVKDGFYPFVYARLEDLEGKVIYEHSAINEELLPNTTISGDTWIRIWSMSKIVTISVALDLVEDGILSLSDPVTKYIPEFENLKVAVTENGTSLTEFEWGNRDQVCPIKLVPNDSAMTVLHLINHEAGFYYCYYRFSLFGFHDCGAKFTYSS